MSFVGLFVGGFKDLLLCSIFFQLKLLKQKSVLLISKTSITS